MPAPARAALAPDYTQTGVWFRLGEQDPFNLDAGEEYIALLADSVTGVMPHQREMSLQVTCIARNNLRVRVKGPTPQPSAQLAGSQYTTWSVRFSDGTVREHEDAKTYATEGALGFVQAWRKEKELVQHLLASRWVWVRYPSYGHYWPMGYFTLPDDTWARVTEIYAACEKKPPGPLKGATGD